MDGRVEGLQTDLLRTARRITHTYELKVSNPRIIQCVWRYHRKSRDTIVSQGIIRRPRIRASMQSGSHLA